MNEPRLEPRRRDGLGLYVELAEERGRETKTEGREVPFGNDKSEGFQGGKDECGDYICRVWTRPNSNGLHRTSSKSSCGRGRSSVTVNDRAFVNVFPRVNHRANWER